MARGFGQGPENDENGAGGDTPDSTPNHRPPLPFLRQIIQYPFNNSPQRTEEESRELLVQLTNQEINRIDNADDLKERFPVYIEHLESALQTDPTNVPPGESHQTEESASHTGHMLLRGVCSDSPSGDTGPPLVGASPVEQSVQTGTQSRPFQLPVQPQGMVGQGGAGPHLIESPSLQTNQSLFSCLNGIGVSPGERLRQLADRFAQTPEREEVRQLAEQFDLLSLNRREFRKILIDLFKHGNKNVIPEKIVILCVFCSDILIKSVRLGCEGMFQNIFVWSLAYINSIIQEYGGWGQVLGVIGSYLVTPIYVGCAIAVTLAAAMYIRKNW